MKMKKLIALVLSLVMVVGLLPTMALAVREPYYDIEFTEDGVTSEYSACVDSEITIPSASEERANNKNGCMVT